MSLGKTKDESGQDQGCAGYNTTSSGWLVQMMCVRGRPIFLPERNEQNKTINNSTRDHRSTLSLRRKQHSSLKEEVNALAEKMDAGDSMNIDGACHGKLENQRQRPGQFRRKRRGPALFFCSLSSPFWSGSRANYTQ